MKKLLPILVAVMFVVACGTGFFVYGAYKDYTNKDVKISNENKELSIEVNPPTNENKINKEFETFKVGVMNVTDTYDVLWEEFESISNLVEQYPNLYKEDLINLSMEYQLLSNSVLSDIEYRQLGTSNWDRIKEEILYPLQEACMHKGNALYGLMRTVTGQDDASKSVMEQMELSNQKILEAMSNYTKLEDELN